MSDMAMMARVLSGHAPRGMSEPEFLRGLPTAR
jgi:hypothetical protein